MSSGSDFSSIFYSSHDGLSLHFRQYPGPDHPAFTVICLPGLTRNARDFEDLAPHLARHYRVWCVELRGRGSSQYAADPMDYLPPTYVDDLAALFDQTGLDAAAFIGTSNGGMIGMLFAATRPQNVLGLILNDVGPKMDRAGLSRIASYVGKPVPVTSWEDAADAIRQTDTVVYPDFGPDDWLRMARRRYVRDPDGSFRLDYDLNLSRAFTHPASRIDLWPFFAQLKSIPTMVIRGAHSDILSPATVERMQDEVPALQVVEVPGRGHVPNLDEPEAIAAIDRFLASLPSQLDSSTRAERTADAAAFAPHARNAGINGNG